VLPIGGLKEKVMAAHRSGMKLVVCPEENQKDTHDIPKNVLKNLELRFVSTIDEVLRAALVVPDADHPNAAMREFLEGEEAASTVDWREVRAFVEKKKRMRELESKRSSEHGPH
jgi:ATP-dependent Lon protease